MSLPWHEQLANDDESQKKWQEFIYKTLNNWLQDPSQLEDEDCDAPTAEIIQLAIEKAKYFKKIRMPPPDNIIQDVNGGIVFSCTIDGTYNDFHIWDDGECTFFQSKR